MKTSFAADLALVNNTGSDISVFDADIRVALTSTGALPVELADVFKATRYVAPDGAVRWVLDFA